MIKRLFLFINFHMLFYMILSKRFLKKLNFLLLIFMSDDKEENKKKKEGDKNSEDKKEGIEDDKKTSEKNKGELNKKENKETKKIISKPKIKNKSIKRYIDYGIVFVILILAGFFAFNMDNTNNNQEDNKEETIVAKVNQEEITREDLDAYKVMLEQEGGASDDMTAIQGLINQKILYQEAKKEIEISPSETEQIMKQQLSNQGMTLEEFKSQVNKQGQDYDEVIGSFKQQIILSQYYQNMINDSGVNITDKEAKDFYEENKEIFLQQAPNSSYEDLEEIIKEKLKSQKTQGLLQEKIMKLRENAEIEIVEENLNQTQQKQMDLSQLQQ